MKIFLILFFTILTIGIICAVAYAIYSTHKKRYKDFLLQNSKCLKDIATVNGKYSFYPYENFDQSHTYDNEKFYDSISCQDYLIYQLQFSSKKIIDYINKLKVNGKRYTEYINEINSIAQFGCFDSPIGKLKSEELIKIEKCLFDAQVCKAPTTVFSITISLYCSKINGYVYDVKRACFYENDVIGIVKRLKNKSGSFYNDRGIWEALCRVERGKVSNKLRFAIYKRDGYRCQKCGASDREAYLEIDHIIPISKGGKSTYDNLQTLCHNCNVQKGDRIK